MTPYQVASIVGMLANLLSIIVFISVILSWFVPPDQPIRAALDRIVDPLLAPIRRIIPMAGMIDFSPMILMILIELVSRILINFILSV
jgi:YggT family protein